METSNYGFSKVVALSFEEAIDKTKSCCQAEGFGNLTTIDRKAKMKEKINVDMENYVILGMCNPKLANEAVQVEYEIGLLLPCNFIVYQKGDTVHVAAQRPSVMSQVATNEALNTLVNTAEEKILKILTAI